MVQVKARWLDIASMALSALCVVHCVALPFVALGMPFLGALTEAGWVHKLLVILAAPLSLWAITYSRAWRKWEVTVFMVAGLVLLAAAAFIPALESIEGHITVIGALMIAAAHGINYLGQRTVHVHTRDCAHGAAAE